MYPQQLHESTFGKANSPVNIGQLVEYTWIKNFINQSVFVQITTNGGMF
jgi:hypothetical protein